MRKKIDEEQIGAIVLLTGVAALVSGIPVVREAGAVAALSVVSRESLTPLITRTEKVLKSIFHSDRITLR